MLADEKMVENNKLNDIVREASPIRHADGKKRPQRQLEGPEPQPEDTREVPRPLHVSRLEPDTLADNGFPTWFQYVTTDCKNIQYSKRMMGEFKRLFTAQGIQEQYDVGVVFRPGQAVGPDLPPFKLDLWHVWFTREGVNKSSLLYKDMCVMDIKAVVMELELPPEFPIEPPFVRVKYPRLDGGYIFNHGGICYEALTKKAWPVATNLGNLMISVKALFDHNPVRIVHGYSNQKTLTADGYTRELAKRDSQEIERLHKGGSGWSKRKQNS